MGKKVSKPFIFTGLTNEGTSPQLLETNVLKRVINYEALKDGEIDKRYDSEVYDSSLNTKLSTDFTSVNQIFVWDTTQEIKGMDSGSPIIIIFGDNKLNAYYKVSGSWAYTSLISNDINLTGVSYIRMVSTERYILCADGVNPLYRIFITNQGEIGMSRVGVPAPEDKIIVQNPKHTAIISDGTDDEYISAGMEKERGTILFYYYTIKTENGDESNPSPLTTYIFDRAIDHTDDTAIGFNSFLSSVELSNLKLPSNIDNDLKTEVKYYCIYRATAVYTNGLVETVETAKKIAQILIQDKDGETVYLDDDIDGTLDLTTEHDQAPICGDVTAMGGKIIIGNITDNTRFLWGFPNAVPIYITNPNDREYINLPIGLTLSESDIDTDFKWDDFSSDYGKRIRFFYEDKRTPLKVLTKDEWSETSKSFIIHIPLVKRGVNVIYLAWDKDNDIVPDDYVSTDEVYSSPTHSNGKNETIAQYYGKFILTSDLFYFSGGVYYQPTNYKIGFLDNMLHAQGEDILFAFPSEFYYNPPILVDLADIVSSGGIASISNADVPISYFIPLITDLKTQHNSGVQIKTEIFQGAILGTPIKADAGNTTTITKSVTRNIQSKGFIGILFIPDITATSAEDNANVFYIKDGDTTPNTFSIGVKKTSDYNYIITLSGNSTTKEVSVNIPGGKAGTMRQVYVLYTWDKGNGLGYVYVSAPMISNTIYSQYIGSSVIDELIGNSLAEINVQGSTNNAVEVEQVIIGGEYIQDEDRAKEIISNNRIAQNSIGADLTTDFQEATITLKNVYGDAEIGDDGTNIYANYTGDVLSDIAVGDYVKISGTVSLNGVWTVASNDGSTLKVNHTTGSSISVTTGQVSKLLEDDDFNTAYDWCSVTVTEDDDNYYLYVKKVGSDWKIYGVSNAVYVPKLSFCTDTMSGLVKLDFDDVSNTGNYHISYNNYTTISDVNNAKPYWEATSNPMAIVYDYCITVYNSDFSSEYEIGWNFRFSGYTAESFTNSDNVKVGDKITYDEHSELIQYNEGELLEFPDLNFKNNGEAVKRLITAPSYLPFVQEHSHIVIVFSDNSINVINVDDDNKPVNVIKGRNGYGLLADNSVVTTPYGVFWLSNEGVVRWDSQGMRLVDKDLTSKKKVIDIKLDEDIKAFYVPQRQQVWFYYESNKDTETATLSLKGNYIDGTGLDAVAGDYIEIKDSTYNDGIYKVVKVDNSTNKIYIDGYFQGEQGTISLVVKDIVYVYDIMRGQWYIFIGFNIDDYSLINNNGLLYNLILYSDKIYSYPSDTLTEDYAEAVKEFREYYSGMNKVLAEFEGSCSLDVEVENSRLTYGGKGKKNLTLSNMQYKLIPDGYYGYKLIFRFKEADKLRYAEMILVQRRGLDEKV